RVQPERRHRPGGAPARRLAPGVLARRVRRRGDPERGRGPAGDGLDLLVRRGLRPAPTDEDLESGEHETGPDGDGARPAVDPVPAQPGVSREAAGTEE